MTVTVLSLVIVTVHRWLEPWFETLELHPDQDPKPGLNSQPGFGVAVTVTTVPGLYLPEDGLGGGEAEIEPPTCVWRVNVYGPPTLNVEPTVRFPEIVKVHVLVRVPAHAPVQELNE